MPKAQPTLAERRAEAERQYVESRRAAFGREAGPVATVLVVMKDGEVLKVVSDTPRLQFAFVDETGQTDGGFGTAQVDGSFVHRARKKA
jgi:hypothetical protein